MRLTRAMAIDWVARAEAYRQTIGSLTAPILPLYWLNLLVAISVGMVPPLLPELAAHWALSTVQAGLIYTVYAVGRLGSCYRWIVNLYLKPNLTGKHVRAAFGRLSALLAVRN